MSDSLKHWVSDAQRHPLPWLQTVNNRGLARLDGAYLPDRKTEAWKYTNLKYLANPELFSLVNPVADIADPASLWQAEYDIADFEAHTLAFVDGCFCPALSTSLSDLPAGVELVPFSQASAAQQQAIAARLDTVVPDTGHLFAAVNSAQVVDGVYLHLAANVVLAKPVKIVHLHSQASCPQTAVLRVLVDLESGSSASLLEQFVGGADNSQCLANSLSEFCLADNARLDHLRLNVEEESIAHVGGVHVALGRSAVIDSFYLAFGSVLKRLDLVVNHRGEGAHCEMRGVYLPRNNQQVDFHTCVEHAVPHCTTNEVFRGIIADAAKAVFNGRIHIHPDAQKTSAQLSNKNLLTSAKAEVDTKPELEIYADDVQCAHGATVAQLDEMAMHYLLTRGVAEDEARVMLSFGFIYELVNALDNESVANYIRPRLARMFARDDRLMRHIT